MTNLPYDIKDNLHTGMGDFSFFSLEKLEKLGYPVSHLPFSIRILLENAIRNYDGFGIKKENIETILNWEPGPSTRDIPFKPARVLMQDFTGVPAVVDLASLRAAMSAKGKDPDRISPLIPVDLVIDHSVQVDYFGTGSSYHRNVEKEYERNIERYQFLKWARRLLTTFPLFPREWVSVTRLTLNTWQKL
jgi:aconitate hydratase